MDLIFFPVIHNSVAVWCHDSFRAKNWMQTYSTTDRPYIKVIECLPQIKNALLPDALDNDYIIVY
jgi:hypothetical protein